MFLSGIGRRGTVAFLTLLTSPVSAFFRLPCSAPLVVERADPIVSPGKPSGHVHTIMGGNGFGFSMTYDDTQAATCSSCKVTQDMSNYWVPKLYYQAKDGTFIDVPQNGGGTIYYLQRTDQKDPEYSKGLLAFPEGFRMLAGNPNLRNYTDIQAQQAASYACLGINGPETHDFPKQPCPSGLRSQIFFPSCWDGVNLDSPDHKSHVSYPSQYNAGFCPTTHPKRFISLFYEVIWDTSSFDNQWYDGHQPFVWAQGDNTGYGYHGDFVNGWKVPILQQAIEQCTDDSGVIEKCSVFEFFDDKVSQGCKIPALIDEVVTGPLNALPGCNPVQGGPDMAKSATGCGAPTMGTPQYTFTDLTVSKGFEYVGCGSDAIPGQPRTLVGDGITQADMTVEKCVDYCTGKGFSIAGTEFGKECYCSNTLPADRAPDPKLMGNCAMPCGGNGKEICGGQGAISIYRKCSDTCHNYLYSNFNNKAITAGNSSNVPPTGPASSGVAGGGDHSSSVVNSLSVSTTLPTASASTQGSSSSMLQGGNDESTTVIHEVKAAIPLSSTSNAASTSTGSPIPSFTFTPVIASSAGTSQGEAAQTVTVSKTVFVCSCPASLNTVATFSTAVASATSSMAINPSAISSSIVFTIITPDLVSTTTKPAYCSSSGKSHAVHHGTSTYSHPNEHKHIRAHAAAQHGH